MTSEYDAAHPAMVEAGRSGGDEVTRRELQGNAAMAALNDELAALRAEAARAGYALADDAAAALSARLAVVEVERDAAYVDLAARDDEVSAYANRLAGAEVERAAARAARPPIVCLCGSTRFFPAFMAANYRETMAGKIVLSVGFYPHSQPEAHGETVGVTPAQKAALDGLHLRKVEMADEILVLNVGGYIGESTARELAHARALGKRVRFSEPEGGPGAGDDRH